MFRVLFQEALQLHLGDEKPPQPNASLNVQETSHIPENGNKRLNTHLSRGMFVEFSFPGAFPSGSDVLWDEMLTTKSNSSMADCSCLKECSHVLQNNRGDPRF